MRLAFLGTPEAAVPSLRSLVAAGHGVEIVITRPERRRGRGSELSPSPVESAARELGLRVGHSLKDLEGVDVGWGVVVAYGAHIPGELLDRVPMLNVHFSLLPRWRGAAPVERAILAGDRETGVSVMSLDVALDTGPVHLERRVEVLEKSFAQLLDELAHLGADALVEVLDSASLLAYPTAQAGEATYAPKVTKETFHLTPVMSCALLLRTVRLGRAFTFVEGRRLLVESATLASDRVASGTVAPVDDQILLGASDGAIALNHVRPEGTRSMDGRSWWAGARFESRAREWG